MDSKVESSYSIAGEPFINFNAGYSKPFRVVSDFDLAGDQGEAVSALQERLIALGYLSESSGVYDEWTAAALKAFQESNGLPADGIAGPNTQQALYAANAIPKS